MAIIKLQGNAAQQPCDFGADVINFAPTVFLILALN
jgi:hypothetical protein